MTKQKITCETYIKIKDLNLFLVNSDYSVRVWKSDNIFTIFQLNPEIVNCKEFVQIIIFDFSNN